MGEPQTNNAIHELRTRVIPHGHASMNTGYVASANGVVIKDVEGKEYISEAVAAVVAEPVQGEGGFIVPPPVYF